MRWLLLLLAGCTLTGGTVLEIPHETNLPTEAYFCPAQDCLSVLARFENASCALYSSTLFHPAKIITADRRKSGLMHNKFCVLGDTVFTGSLNPTERNIKQANNLLVIHSRYVADLYRDEYDELQQGTFGGGDVAKYSQVILNNQSVGVRFCPEDHCKKAVLDALSSATSSIIFALNAFTDKDVAAILIARNRTIRVYGVIDTVQTTPISDTLPGRKRKNIHDKFFVIDGRTVITGSANPSGNGYFHNDENIVFLDDPVLATQYTAEINRLY